MPSQSDVKLSQLPLHAVLMTGDGQLKTVKDFIFDLLKSGHRHLLSQKWMIARQEEIYIDAEDAFMKVLSQAESDGAPEYQINAICRHLSSLLPWIQAQVDRAIVEAPIHYYVADSEPITVDEDDVLHKKILTYEVSVPEGKGPTFLVPRDAVEEIVRHLKTLTELFLEFELIDQDFWTKQVSILKDGETWHAPDGIPNQIEYRITCEEMTWESYLALGEFDGY